jgi:HD-GYP domain-containing protein (c-di-GMP phosphodiesterase class II)
MLGWRSRRQIRECVSTATALLATLDQHDRYTVGHSVAVAIYARDIVGGLLLSADDQQLAYAAGLVHDLGKIGIPSELLHKRGALSIDERELIQRHVLVSERILSSERRLGALAPIARSQAEPFDGTGYPDGLSGEEIPLLSRIIAVANAYSEITSDRLYRDALPSRVARPRLAQAVETQFDPAVVAAFESRLVQAASTGWPPPTNSSSNSKSASRTPR